MQEMAIVVKSIATSEDIVSFGDMVNDRLRHGWRLHGNVSTPQISDAECDDIKCDYDMIQVLVRGK